MHEHVFYEREQAAFWKGFRTGAIAAGIGAFFAGAFIASVVIVIIAAR